MTQSTHVVYAPPAAGHPYLAVSIAIDGTVIAVPYENEEDAKRHIHAVAVVESKGEEEGAGPLGTLLP